MALSLLLCPGLGPTAAGTPLAVGPVLRGALAALLLLATLPLQAAGRDLEGDVLPPCAAAAPGEALCDEDGAALLQGVARARAGRSKAFPDSGGLEGLEDPTDKAASAESKAVLLELARRLGETLLPVERRAEAASKAMEREDLIGSVAAVVNRQIGKASAGRPEANATLLREFEEANATWAAVAAAGQAAARALAPGLERAGMGAVASGCDQKLKEAMRHADGLAASLEQAKSQIFQVSASKAPAQLGRVGRLVDEASKDAGGFAEAFEATFDELYEGVAEGLIRQRASAKTQAAAAGPLDAESRIEVKAAFSGVLQTAQSIVGKTLGITGALAGGVKSGLEASGVRIDKSTAPRPGTPRLLAATAVAAAAGFAY